MLLIDMQENNLNMGTRKKEASLCKSSLRMVVMTETVLNTVWYFIGMEF